MWASSRRAGRIIVNSVTRCSARSAHASKVRVLPSIPNKYRLGDACVATFPRPSSHRCLSSSSSSFSPSSGVSSKNHVFTRTAAQTASVHKRQILVILSSFFGFVISSNLYGCKTRSDALEEELEALKLEVEAMRSDVEDGKKLKYGKTSKELMEDPGWLDRISSRIAAATSKRSLLWRWFGRGEIKNGRDEGTSRKLIRDIIIEELAGGVLIPHDAQAGSTENPKNAVNEKDQEEKALEEIFLGLQVENKGERSQNKKRYL